MERKACSETVNNAFYDDLGLQWYDSQEHPIALLRAENKVRNPWIQEEIVKRFYNPIAVLDIGCGAGFLTNFLSQQGHSVTGIDLSETSLQVAQERDETKRVVYQKADGCNLPFAKESFDVVCAMDILEHVQDPKALIAQASFVLKPGGLFFFHTFNRNLFSYLFVVKGMEWFVKNTPPRLHLYSFFLKPKEVERFCAKEGLSVELYRGFNPKCSLSLLQIPFLKKIPKDLSFSFSKTLLAGYCGIAKK